MHDTRSSADEPPQVVIQHELVPVTLTFGRAVVFTQLAPEPDRMGLEIGGNVTGSSRRLPLFQAMTSPERSVLAMLRTQRQHGDNPQEA